MSDPFSILPLAIAAGGGSVDGHPAAALVSAGLTLLQRGAPVVRALRGRRSAILLPTSPAFFTALGASDGRGAVLINPLASPLEVAYQVADAGVGAVFTNQALLARAPANLLRILLDDAPRSAGVILPGDFEPSATVDLGSHHPLELEGDPAVEGRDEEVAVVYTSAMAGRPLGAILTHRNLLANARSTVEAAGNSSDDHVLAVLPFSHLFGLTVTALAPLLAGARVTTMDRFNPRRATELLETADVSEFVGVPAVFAGLLALLARAGRRLDGGSLRLCICGGAVLSPELQDRWFEATGVELRQGYGLTEGGPMCLFNRVSLPNQRGYLGVPFPGVDVEIREPGTDRPLHAGIEGEICVRGANVFSGYIGGSSDGLLVRDGWLGTGDRGIQQPDGTVAFTGLYKAMFTRGGFNIYPAELERVVREMPGVRTARVGAIFDPARENEISMDVSGAVTRDGVEAWCSAHLSVYKQPAVITIVA